MDKSIYTDDYWAGTAALHAGKLREAIAAFERVPGEVPCWVMAQGNIGLALLQLDRNPQAETRLRFVLGEIEHRGCPYPPARIQFMRNLAEAIGKQGRRVEAIGELARAFDAADSLAKDNPSLSGKIACEKAHVLNSWGMELLLLGQPARAVAVFNQARDIYRSHSGNDLTGHAEVLTNLATALAKIGKMTAADLALTEATDILEKTGDYDQLFRTLIVAAQMGSSLVQEDRVLELVEAEAEEALDAGRPGTAYVRYCTGVSFVLEQKGSVDVGRRMVCRGREIEDRLDPLDPHVPKLRYLEALVLRLAGEPMTRITHVLLEGAHQWYRRIAAPLVPADFLSVATDLHMHFRALAACLLDSGRAEEALVAFDAGRGLGYAVQVDPGFYARVITQNPFAADGSAVDLPLLRQAQQTMGSDEVGLVLAVIPPRLIAFIVGRDHVAYIARPIAAAQADLDNLNDEIILLPGRLAAGVGLRAVPQHLLEFSQEVVREIGTRSVSAFIPYDALHLVPWRTVLKESGLPWHRLAFPIGFNFLLRRGNVCSQGLGKCEVIALGHGTAGAVDLQEEARQFAAAFGAGGKTVLRSTAEDVRHALEANSIVLLSCHGKAINQSGDLRLELSSGSASTEEVFPLHVASPLVILSACDSGVYLMAWGDFPIGAAPALIRRGADCVIGARFPLNASFAAEFFQRLARSLAAGTPIGAAFASTLSDMEGVGADLWRDLACLELLSGA